MKISEMPATVEQLGLLGGLGKTPAGGGGSTAITKVLPPPPRDAFTPQTLAAVRARIQSFTTDELNTFVKAAANGDEELASGGLARQSDPNFYISPMVMAQALPDFEAELQRRTAAGTLNVKPPELPPPPGTASGKDLTDVSGGGAGSSVVPYANKSIFEEPLYWVAIGALALGGLYWFFMRRQSDVTLRARAKLNGVDDDAMLDDDTLGTLGRVSTKKKSKKRKSKSRKA